MKSNTFKEHPAFANQDCNVHIVGYGEKKIGRINMSLEPSVQKKAKFKCDKMGISLSEAVNQLLYQWSKDISDEDIETNCEAETESDQTNLFNGK